MTILVKLEFDGPLDDPNSVRGRIVLPGRRGRPFCGWLQLLGALEDATRGRASGAPTAPDPTAAERFTASE